MKPRKRQHGSLNISNSRWIAYAVAGLATASGGAISAKGAIHYSGLVNFKFDKDSGNYQIHQFPLSQGVTLVGSRFVRGSVDNSAGLYLQGAAVGSGFCDFRNFGSAAVALPRGALISHQTYFGPFGRGLLQDYACEFPDFLDPGTYAVGFRFDNGAGNQYGWVRIKWGGCSYNGYIVKDYAWGDPGDQVKVGQTQLDEDVTQVAPQAAKSADAAPLADSQGSLGLLALGAVGLQAWRRARRGDEHGA